MLLIQLGWAKKRKDGVEIPGGIQDVVMVSEEKTDCYACWRNWCNPYVVE